MLWCFQTCQNQPSFKQFSSFFRVLINITVWFINQQCLFYLWTRKQDSNIVYFSTGLLRILKKYFGQIFEILWSQITYVILAEGPGVAHGKKKNFGFFLNKIFFSLCHPQATHKCPQKISAHSVQPFGRLWNINTNFLFYYIDTSLRARLCPLI